MKIDHLDQAEDAERLEAHGPREDEDGLDVEHHEEQGEDVVADLALGDQPRADGVHAALVVDVLLRLRAVGPQQLAEPSMQADHEHEARRPEDGDDEVAAEEVRHRRAEPSDGVHESQSRPEQAIFAPISGPSEPISAPYDGRVAPSYHRLGEVPRKRHVAFRAPDGALYPEEVVGTEGFSGRYSILYHRYAPTRVLKVAEAEPGRPVARRRRPTRRCATTCCARRGLDRPAADELAGRRVLLWNDDVRLAVSAFGAGPGPARAQRRGRRAALRPRGRRQAGVGLRRPRLPGRRLRGRAQGHDPPLGAGRRRQPPPRDRDAGRGAPPPPLPERRGPAARARPVLGAGLPPADRAASPATTSTRPTCGCGWATGRRSTRSTTTRSTSSGGTATSIRTPSRSTTSSRSAAASTSRRRCTRPSSSTAPSCARSCPAGSTTAPTW